ncbi:MAG: Smr/MutS family protein [Deltaproteobacteria bacterium]|nr:Smr/MutS family protein [Deltaproteobacteria bacterium]
MDALVEIDVAFAAARYALFLNAHEPEIAEEGETHLEALRHPLLVGRGFDVVANDVTLEASARCVLITGPNAGGKTVLLKALGLALLMTRAGLHPPAGPGSRVADWGGVHAIIGDEQSIEAGLSTFAAMLASLKTILDAAAPGGLVLLDEIGEGTDPRQGVALSMAVLERLAERGVRTIATTHFAELAAMAEARDGFVNASMEFDRERMAPTYRLRLGVPGRSGAFDVAAKMGLDPAIVARARELYEGASSELDEIMEGMDATMRDLEERRREAERDRAEARRLLDLQRDRLKELEERMKKQAASSLRAVESEYETARERIREAVAALQRGPTFQTADEARKTIDENVVRARRVTPPQTERADEPGEPVRGPLEDGDRVWVRTLRAWGRAEGPADAKGRVRVTVGGARVESTVEDLRAGERKAEAPAVHVRTPVLGSESAGADERTLDLRGERSDDARDRVSEFLDAAYRSRWDRVTIVHGHGTGVLKKEVRDMLRGAPYRMNFRPGERGEGGDGATVVEFEFV